MTYRGEQMVKVGCLVRENAPHPLSVCDFHSAILLFYILCIVVSCIYSDDLMLASPATSVAEIYHPALVRWCFKEFCIIHHIISETL